MFEFNYITPIKYFQLEGNTQTLKEIKRLASQPDSTCENCENDSWKLVGLGMCFSCVTGETDASDDYELIEH